MRALFPVKDATYPCARAPCIAFGVNFSPAIWVVAVHVRCPDHVLPVAEMEDPIIGFSSMYTWVQSSNLKKLSSDYKGVNIISLGSFQPNSYVLAPPLVTPTNERTQAWK